VERDNAPRWDGRRGHYEVWFLTMTHGRIGYWIRYTLRAPVAGPPEREAWFARFDPDDPARTFGLHGPPDGAPVPGGYFRVGESVLEPGTARGHIAGPGHEARWDLQWDGGQPTFRVLPPVLYRAGLAPTKPFTPNPDVRFSGTIEADGERVAVDGAPGQQGHLYGSRHAERWAWASCNRFVDDGWAFQALSAQGRRGPLLTPFLTFAGLRIDGRWVRFRGTSRRRTWALGTWRLRLEAKAYRLEGEVRAFPDHLIRARYLDPDDTPRFCHNSEVASARLVLWERRAGGWQEAAGLVSEGTTHAEWAGRTPAPGVETVHAEVA
jgi:hypothetical protein